MRPEPTSPLALLWAAEGQAGTWPGAWPQYVFFLRQCWAFCTRRAAPDLQSRVQKLALPHEATQRSRFDAPAAPCRPLRPVTPLPQPPQTPSPHPLPPASHARRAPTPPSVTRPGPSRPSATRGCRGAGASFQRGSGHGRRARRPHTITRGAASRARAAGEPRRWLRNSCPSRRGRGDGSTTRAGPAAGRAAAAPHGPADVMEPWPAGGA